MAIFKDGGTGEFSKSYEDAKEKAFNEKEKYFSKEKNMFIDVDFLKNSSNDKPASNVKEKSYTDLYIEGNFAGIFNKAKVDATSMKHNQSNEDDLTMLPFYDFLHETMMREIVQFNKVGLFLEELNHFLDDKDFTDADKNTFLNSNHNTLIEESLKMNRFDIAQKINAYRPNKDVKVFYKLIEQKCAEENYEAVEQILSLSTGVARQNSEIVRILFANGCRDLELYKKIVSTYNLDINGVGKTFGYEGETSLVHFVACASGTKGTPFFYSFVKEFNDKIDFSVNTVLSNGIKLNLMEKMFISKLEDNEKLNRTSDILENCSLSVKHIVWIANKLVSTNSNYSDYYDHSVYDSLFKHKQFNSEQFDRESILNKIVENDTSKDVLRIRKVHNNMVNPTSIILNKYFKNAKSAVATNKHPFITWVEGQRNKNFCKDTLKCLITNYGDELLSLEFNKINIESDVVGVLKEVLEENGFNYPRSPTIREYLFGKNVEMKLVRVSQPKAANEDLPYNANKEENSTAKAMEKFPTTLIEQVKDGEIKKLVESIQFNYEQYHTMENGGVVNDNVHYMTTLLPKFLRTTIDNYLHFSTIAEEEAKENVMVQLKILNRKTFTVLKEELERDQKDLEFKNSVHKNVISRYK